MLKNRGFSIAKLVASNKQNEYESATVIAAGSKTVDIQMASGGVYRRVPISGSASIGDSVNVLFLKGKPSIITGGSSGTGTTQIIINAGTEPTPAGDFAPSPHDALGSHHSWPTGLVNQFLVGTNTNPAFRVIGLADIQSVADTRYALKERQISAGVGLDGGGGLSSNVNLFIKLRKIDEISVNGLAVSSGGLYINSGAGLSIDGNNKLAINVGNGIAISDNNSVTLKLKNGLRVDSDGLYINLALESGLKINTNGLFIDLASPSGLITTNGLAISDTIAGTGIGINNKQLFVGATTTISETTPAYTGLQAETDGLRVYASYNPGPSSHILATDSNGHLTIPLLTANTSITTKLIISPSGQSLTLQPVQDLILAPTGVVKLMSEKVFQSDGWASQTSGMRITHSGSGDFRYLFTDELHTKSFIADLEQALAGGQIIAKSVAVVAEQFTLPSAGNSATIRVRDLPSAENMAVFENGDWIGFRIFSRASGSLTIGWAYGTVSGYADGSGAYAKTQTWTFTRSAAHPGFASGDIYPDAIVLDFGQNILNDKSAGYYEVNAIDGQYGENSPYAQIVTWDTYPGDLTVRSRFGNLKGLFSTAGEFGFYAGSGTDTDDRYIRASNTAIEFHNTPIRLYDGSDETMHLSAGQSNQSPYLAMGSPLPSGPLTQNNNGLWMGKDVSDYKFRIGSVNNSGVLTGGMLWDGSKLNIAGNLSINNSLGTPVIEMDNSGNAVVSGVLKIQSSGGFYAGTGSFSQPSVGLKIWNSGTYGQIAGYSGGTAQWYAGTDGKLYAGGGDVLMGETGLSLKLAEANDGLNASINTVRWASDNYANTTGTIYQARSTSSPYTTWLVTRSSDDAAQVNYTTLQAKQGIVNNVLRYATVSVSGNSQSNKSNASIAAHRVDIRTTDNIGSTDIHVVGGLSIYSSISDVQQGNYDQIGAGVLRFGTDTSISRKSANILRLGQLDALESYTYSSFSGWRIDSTGSADFNNVRVRGAISASMFDVDEVHASAGTLGVYKNASTLHAEFSSPSAINSSANALIKNNESGIPTFSVNDILHIRVRTSTGLASCWYKVNAIPAPVASTVYTTYSLKLMSGTTSAYFGAGTAVVDFGQSGAAVITLSADNTIPKPPNISLFTHSGEPWSSLSMYARIGNLKGRYGFGNLITDPDIYGFAAGDESGTYISADSTNGLKIKKAGVDRFSVNTSGHVEIHDSSGTARIVLDTDGLKIKNSAGSDVIKLDQSGSSYFAGVLTIGANGEIRQGTGTIGTNYQGIRIWRDPTLGVGQIAGYTSTDTSPQWYAHTDGKLYAADGNVQIDKSGVSITPDSLRARFGNLKGVYGYGSGTNIYGFAAGNTSSSYVSIEDTNGFRVVKSSVVRFQVNANGDLFINNASGTPVITLDDAGSRIENTLNIGDAGVIYQGNGTVSQPGTGLKIYAEKYNDVTKLTVTATGGTFNITVVRNDTGASATANNVAFNVDAATLQSTLALLSSVGTGNVTVTKASNVFTITFGGARAYTKMTITVATGSLTGGTATVAIVTEGGRMGAIAGYNQNTVQWYAHTDGRLYAGGGNAQIAQDGFSIYSSSLLRGRFGNLNGTYGYATNINGLAAGDSSTTFVSVEDTNGFRVVKDSKVRFQVDPTGNLYLNNPSGAHVITLDDAGSRIENALNIGVSGGIYEGNGSFSDVKTGLKIYSNPYNDVSTLTVTATGGTFTLTVVRNDTNASATTAGIAPNVSASSLQSTIGNLSSVGSGNVTVTKSGNVFTITFNGQLQYVPMTITVATGSLTGGTATLGVVTNGGRIGTITGYTLGVKQWEITQGGLSAYAASSGALRSRMGNLNGVYGYTSEVYGFAAGDTSSSYVSVEDVNGFRVVKNGLTRFQVDANGVMRLYNQASGRAAITSDSTTTSVTDAINIGVDGGFYQGTGSFNSPGTGIKIWSQQSGSDYIGTIAGYTSGTAQWYAGTDGKLYAGAGKVLISSSGITLTGGSISTMNFAGSIQFNDSSSTAASLGLDTATGTLKLYLGSANTLLVEAFSAGGGPRSLILAKGGSPFIGWNGNDSPVDTKVWDMGVSVNNWYLRTQNDAGTALSEVLKATRTTGSTTVEFFQINATNISLLGSVSSPNSDLDIITNTQLKSGSPFLRFWATDSAANNRRWDVGVTSSQFQMRLMNDANTSALEWFTATRSANTITALNIASTSTALSGSLSATNATFTGGLNIGSATGAGSGSIQASQQVRSAGWMHIRNRTFSGTYTTTDDRAAIVLGGTDTAQSWFIGADASTTSDATKLGFWSWKSGTAWVMTLDPANSGRVGIKTQSPSYTLDVSGDIRATGGLNVNTTGAAAGEIKANAGISGTDGTFTGGLNIGTATGATAGSAKVQLRMALNGATLSTQATMNVCGQINTYPTATGNPGEAALRVRGGNSSGTAESVTVLDISASGSAGQQGGWLQVRNSSDYSTNYHLLLNPNGGNVGIGVTSTSYTLDVDGSIRATGNLTLSAANIITDTATGTKIGTATTQRLGFFNATPVAQRAGAAQAAVATTGATNTTPYGFTTAAQANAIITLLNEIRATLVELGLMKGAA